MHIFHRLKVLHVVCNWRRDFSLHHRLCFKCLDSVLNNATDRRNIGIIAHIDAGKTTVTERLLYLSGLTTTIGDVDNGNTITDFMELERERGITIQSAAITSMWRNHRINLIDTPGHVDFTLEVERALRVMDGTVTILDGSAGVQAQTLTVWRQALKFGLPSIFFVNKMDKPVANFEKCVDSVQQRLGHSVVPMVVPIVRENSFVGAINILDRTFLDTATANPDVSVWSEIESNSKYADICDEHLDNLISRLSDVDEEFEKRLFSDEKLSAELIRNALRTATLGRRLSPIACGTALRSTESVRPLLDMIVDFLPGPSERIYNLPKTDFCALVFKVGHDERHGQLGYTRVYKGTLRSGQSAQNANRNARESGLRLFTPYSDVLHPTEKVEAGDVAVISGLKSTITGDTLVSGFGATKITELELRKCVLEGIESPAPVFSCSIEPPSSSAIHEFERALAELCVEDPSLRIVRDSDTSQIILQGMGELHIEVIKERLKREYGLNVFMGQLRVGYREILNESVTKTSFTEDLFGDNKQKHWCSLSLQLDPTKANKKFDKVHVEIEDEDESPIIREDWLDAINEGCRIALYNGPLLGFPVGSLMITLKALSTSGNRVNSALLSASASRCVKEALQAVGTQLIEPIMRLELSVIAGASGTANDKCDGVFRELSHRRASITSIDESSDGHLTVIHATIPLSETTGIANKVRELTSGLCGLHMELGEYERVLPEEQSAIIERHMHGSI